MTPAEFVAKWTGAELSERAASQEHFLDLCHLLDQPTPAQADPAGDSFTFEKAVKVVGAASKGSKGDSGFVDVWKKGFFGWEYKRKDKYKNLDEAYRQLYQYRDALLNPPLSVVCDIRTLEIRTHFPGYPPDKTTIRLEEIPAKLEILRRVFTEPNSFRATLKTSEETTKELAKEFGELADALIGRFPPSDLSLFDRAGDPVAHFLMKVMFCLFTQDIGLLPDKLFSRLINRCLFEPENFQPAVSDLFDKMRKGGWYGNDRVEYFNGGLFDEKPPLVLNHAELSFLARAAARPWHAVEPSIFGTLFERILDPKKRAQIGAHYTGKDDILLVVEPVILQPLRREWEELQEQIKDALAKHDAEPDRKKRDLLSAPIKVALENFRQHLGKLRVLDPACGSGNFLYVALQQLLDLEDEIIRFAATHDIYVDAVPHVRPPQMHGIEINPYAAELAQAVIWIGYLQWLHIHGISDPRRPLLDKLECIENRDAIVDLTDKKHPKLAEWPRADFIVGNPPFLGSKHFRDEGLNETYITALFNTSDLPKTVDLCCYWFDAGRRQVLRNKKTRVGLLATQAIRGVSNREVLQRITADCGIFMAWADRPWVLDGAAVRVSMIGFDSGTDREKHLNGDRVARIEAGLVADIDLTTANPLQENSGLAFQGQVKVGSFELAPGDARKMLASPNPSGRSNLDIVRPWINASDVVQRPTGYFIIDFQEMSRREAANYAAPFHHVEIIVRPERENNKDRQRRENWWRLGRSGADLRKAKQGLSRVLTTPRVSKHRVFVWVEPTVVPDARVVCIASAKDVMFGVLESAIHGIWSLRQAARHGDGEQGGRPTYSNIYCFETFALPWAPGREEVKHSAYRRIAAAAKELNALRERWLNPPEWIEPLAKRIDAADSFADVPAEARGLIRQSAIMAAAAKDERLKKRTLTNLYNERPTWLKLAHAQLDRAVLAAYAAVDPAGHWQEDWAAVWVDSGAGQKLPADHPLFSERARVDQLVLGNLLRMNQERAGGGKPKKETR